MKKSKSANNHYTFMFFPESKGTPFTLRIHRNTLYLTGVSIILIIIGLLILLFKTGEIALKLQQVHNLKEDNVRLQEHNYNLQISSQKIANIDSLTAYLNRLASFTGWNAEGAAPPPPRPPAAAERDRPDTDELQTTRTESAPPDARSARMDIAATAGGYIASVPNIIPADGWITKHFSANPADAHRGMDIAAAAGTPIRATAMGVVEDVRIDRYFGLLVEVRHENGFVTRYGHCSQVLVTPGDRVNRGQTIALVGNTGRSTAPHLHYEVMRNGKYVDPMSFIGAQRQ